MYDYIIKVLENISNSGTMLVGNNYDPAYNVVVMVQDIQELIRSIEYEINKKQKCE